MTKALNAVNKAARVAIEKGLNVSIHSVGSYVNVRFYQYPAGESGDFAYIDDKNIYYNGQEGLMEHLNNFISCVTNFVENYGKTENIAEGA